MVTWFNMVTHSDGCTYGSSGIRQLMCVDPAGHANATAPELQGHRARGFKEQNREMTLDP